MKEGPFSQKAQNEQISALQQAVDDLEQWQIGVNGDLSVLIQAPTVALIPQAVNQIFNGEFTHSVGSWGNSATADNRRYECEHWFSHPVIDGQPMYPNTTTSGNASKIFTDTDVNTGSDVITITGHGFLTGTGILLTSSSPPAPLVTNTVYYVITLTVNTIQLATTYANAIAGTPINLTTAGGAVTDFLLFNYTLKTPQHTLYSPLFSDWSWTNPSAGCARFQGDKSIDALIPGTNIQPGYTYYAAFNIVKLNQYVTQLGASAERLWAGLYAKSPTWDWIGGDFEIDYEIVGTAPSGTTSRDYYIYVQTDRGFTVGSTVLTVANAPNDASFAAGSRVYLSWKNVLRYGVQIYNVYRKTGATYVLLQTITTGQTNTLDNNGVFATAAGFPPADFDRLVAYSASIADLLDFIPYSGDPLSPRWGTFPLALKVPQNYDMTQTDLTAYQWLRWGWDGIPGNLDLLIPDGGVIANGDTTLSMSASQFSVDQIGCDVEIRQGDLAFASTIASFTTANEVELADPSNIEATDAAIIIYAGAPAHSIFIDLAHLDYIQGAAYAPNAADTNGTHGPPPVAPNGTTQGGGGGGGIGIGGDGGILCLFDEEMIVTSEGEMLAQDVVEAYQSKKKVKLDNGEGGFNNVARATFGISDVWYLETEEGIGLRATLAKQLFTPKGKRTIKSLNKGDIVYTMLDGKKRESVIFIKTLLQKKQRVVLLSLEPTDSFLAGTNGYFVVSNNKPVFDPQ